MDIYSFFQIIKSEVIDFFYDILDYLTVFKVKLLYFDSFEPYKADPGSAGYDVFSVENLEILPRTRQLVKIGISIQIPRNYYLRCAPRSSLSVKGIDVGAGVIDSSYRGEVCVLLINNSENPFIVKVGDKIAQLIMERCSNTNILVSSYLTNTSRGSGGFGSSDSE